MKMYHVKYIFYIKINLLFIYIYVCIYIKNNAYIIRNNL